MNLHTFDELEDLAWGMLDGEIEPRTIADLVPTERLTALELAFVMALCKLGVLSPVACAAFKLKIYHENKQFAVEFNHLYIIYDRWIADTRDACMVKTAYDKALKANQEHEANRLASVIIDKLTNDNVHYKLYERYCCDEDCRAQTEQAAREVIDNMDNYDSRLPYSTIVSSLFKFFKPERMVKLWEQLGVDYPDPVMTRTPKKQDDNSWAIKTIEKIYGKIKDKKLPDVQKKQAMSEQEQNVSVQSV